MLISFSVILPGFCQNIKSLDRVETKKLINLDVKDMELSDVIKMIADQSDLNIITSKTVRGKVSISLHEVGIEEALDAILKVNNYVYIKDGNILQVYSLPEFKQYSQYAILKTKVYSLKYIRADDLKPLLMSLKSERGNIEADPKTNRIIVIDTVETIASIEEAISEMDKQLETKIYRISYSDPLELQKSILSFMSEKEGEIFVDNRTNSLIVTASPLLLNKIDVLIRNWDKQIPQVLIEAKIMQITIDKGKVLSLDWQYQPSEKHSITVGVKDLPLATGATYVDAFKVGILDTDGYAVTLRALEGLSDANLISSPRIVTLDNEEAKILIGSSEPYEVLHYDTEGHLTTKEIKFVEVGIKLTVTPKIAEDSFVTMKIHPEISSPRKGTVTDALAIDTTEATTILRVKDGNTVVLGGLIKDDEEEHVSQIPLLGDIPLLGRLFRSNYIKHTKKEIIIFITPRILTTGQRLSEIEEDSLKHIDKKIFEVHETVKDIEAKKINKDK